MAKVKVSKDEQKLRMFNKNSTLLKILIILNILQIIFNCFVLLKT
jgi:hypothetical protein